jgi:branched-chain amino acid aminotransferase
MSDVRMPPVWWNGAVVPWETAQIPVTALRGLNVFDGIRAYWRAEGQKFAAISLSGHIERLEFAARLMHIAENGLVDQLAKGISELLAATDLQEDVYLRLTLYVDSGQSNLYPDVTPAQHAPHRETSAQPRRAAPVGAFISCHAIGPRPRQPVTCTISSWQRMPEMALPTLVKTGSSYAAFRLARVEAMQRGVDQAILLNAQGMVTETAEAAVFLVRHGRIYVPPLSDGLLDSLTRRTVIDLAHAELGLPVVECSITRSELYTADEVFIAGTWEEIRVVDSIDGHRPRHRHAPVGNALRTAYIDMCSGRRAPLDDEFVQLLP